MTARGPAPPRPRRGRVRGRQDAGHGRSRWPSLAVTANPIGLVVGGGAKLYGEGTGSDTIEGAAKRTADEIAAQLRTAAEEQGWI